METDPEGAAKKDDAVLPVAEVQSDANKKKKAESGIKIRVGDNTEGADATKTDGVNTQDADMVESGYVDSENPYLYDVSGVKRNVINYGQTPLNADLEDYDLDK